MEKARSKILSQIIEEVAEYIAELEDKYRLTDKEIIRILDAVKENYEWSD